MFQVFFESKAIHNLSLYSALELVTNCQNLIREPNKYCFGINL